MRTSFSETKESGKNRPVSRTEYNALLERLEELEDALDVLHAQERGRSADAWQGHLINRLLAGEPPLRLWREHRGLTLAELSRKTAIAAGYLSEIETGKKPGSVASLKKCANVLKVDLDDLVSPPPAPTKRSRKKRETKH